MIKARDGGGQTKTSAPIHDDETLTETTCHPPSYAKAKKMKSLAPRPIALCYSLKDCYSSSSS